MSPEIDLYMVKLLLVNMSSNSKKEKNSLFKNVIEMRKIA